MSQLLRFLVIAGTLTGYARSLSTFQWPNPLLSYADNQLYEGPLDIVVQGCPLRDNTTISAQWLRIAYHDMSTHDVDSGTGGLDASIMYELDRPQNVGEGMIQSLQDFNGFELTTPFFGMADMIALGAVFAVVGCGGPVIPFSAGRVDATVAGPATVPEPQQDLASHIESFRQQGFNETEMIALVACGHTLGGVRQVDFPVNCNGYLDRCRHKKILYSVSQYLQNTTQDVLVVGPNVTTQSDLRIFSSDGNVYHAKVRTFSPSSSKFSDMNIKSRICSLLSVETFSDTCAALFQRMLNTVPSTVNLTDPITDPFQYVINDPLFSYQNGTFTMLTALRVVNPSASATVNMLWADQQGASFCSSTGCSVQSSRSQPVFFTIVGVAQGFTASRYFFNATINATSSISKFWFEVNNNDGSDPVIVDNGGSGFVIEQDPSLSLFVDVTRSEGIFLETPTTFSEFFKVVVAVLGDATSATASMTGFQSLSAATAPPFTPTTTSISLELDETNPPEGGFIFFTANVSTAVSFLDITANVGSTSYTVNNFNLGAAADFLAFIEVSS
ncbi:heme peroxidase [Gymnopus androsaceus JB14]|uniref:Peroxidase n=1 Tax=Gymnopus androsaceus JB14 TaxID=1447944 RepID=A0A6A4IAC6_9AGAR|nr:heme peroxidase [Gymnopus androsaceus JB14]